MTDPSVPLGVNLKPRPQRQIVKSPLNVKLFVSGPMGTGKTTAGVERMRYLLEQGVPGNRSSCSPHNGLCRSHISICYIAPNAAGGEVTHHARGWPARRVCDLFWPIAAEPAGFAHPDQPPFFCHLKPSQYYMAHIVRPLLDEGYSNRSQWIATGCTPRSWIT